MDQDLLEDQLGDDSFNFNHMFREAALKGQLYVMQTVFDRVLIHCSYAVLTAAEVGDVEWVDKILYNWDSYTKRCSFYEDLSSTLRCIVINACRYDHGNLINYLFEKDHAFPTHYLPNGSLLDAVQYVKPDPNDGLMYCKVELLPYFISKGATKFDLCLRRACRGTDLDFLKYSLSLFQASTDVKRKKEIFSRCLMEILLRNNSLLLKYFLPHHYDLTAALNILHCTSEGDYCSFLVVQAINEDTRRFDFSTLEQKNGKYIFVSKYVLLALINYGLSHQIMEKLAPQFLKKCLKHHKTKCELLKRYFCIVLPSDVFSLLKPFFAYDKRSQRINLNKWS